MKKTMQITGILLMLILAGNSTLTAQRGIRGSADTTGMNRARKDEGFRHMGIPGQKGDSLMMKRMHEGFARGPMRGDMRGPGRDDRFGMRNRMTPPPSEGNGFRQGRPGMRGIESIQNLTVKQKTEIAALRKTQQEEMKKFRDEMNVKIQGMREDHKKKLLGILTEEQRKQLGPELSKPVPAAPAAK
jgi:hypothetical protein